jgi:benzil reductase ((S)-benzoin forming)
MIYLITGVSKGLGKALAELFLKNGSRVIGVGRSHSIDHENFAFVQCDLGDVDQVKALVFPSFSEPVTLINNAGILGNVKRMSDQAAIDLQNVLQVNTIAPMEIIHKVYRSLNNPNDLTVVNISSGAANRAIPSWAAYCASKAALNMLTETFFQEEREKGNSIKVYAVAPGVIDTNMQETIRSTNSNDFSAVENFRAMKEEGVLFSPEQAASKLQKLLMLPYSFDVENVEFDLRDITEK